VLFIHRDAEKALPSYRRAEIKTTVQTAEAKGCRIPAVTLVPVRMSEAWLLFGERAIRHAAGNPNGTKPLNLPSLGRIEDRPDPKSDLRFALEAASELSGRRLKKFNTSQAFWRIVDFLEDLRQHACHAGIPQVTVAASQS
jgi:hypothetical protein